MGRAYAVVLALRATGCRGHPGVNEDCPMEIHARVESLDELAELMNENPCMQLVFIGKMRKGA